MTGGGQSIAVWKRGDVQAERSEVGRCAGHPTLLFCDDETGFADSLVVDGDQLYGITCPASGFLSSTCLLARAPLEDALDATKWQAWNGSSFGALSGATPIFEGALNPRFFHDDYASAWMVIYSTPESNEVDYRTAPALTGPWSDGAQLFVATDPNPTYDAYVQPDYSDDGGRVVYVTFSRSTSEFGSELVLERVVLSR